MKFTKCFSVKVVALCMLLLVPAALSAQSLLIASGAGYKKPVTELIKSFQKDTGIKTEAAFGNMQMISNQAKQSGDVACIIGDKKFLAGMEPDVKYTAYNPLGKGILVIAYRKGIKLKKPEDLESDRVKSIFLPEDKKAIYGAAGTEALKSYGYTEKLANKITRSATVPQVVSYLLSGEADAGFINLTEALANKDKLGGYITIPEDKYGTILIVAGTVKGFEKKAELIEFIEYIQTKKTKMIFEKYGLK